MRAIGRLIIVLTAALGGVTGSQAPEFAQQYRQRLGGALEELRRVVADFDAAARRNRISRDVALGTYASSNTAFLRDQGLTMRGTIDRFDRLSDQRRRLDAAPAYMRPVVMLSGPDESVVSGTWNDFEPGVPLTPAGFVWAALGFFALGGAASLLRQVFGLTRRRQHSATRA